MSTIVNSRSITPDQLASGQVALFTVKVMITRPGRYRVYNCSPGADPYNGIPQGSRVLNEAEICQALFPTLANNAEPDS